MAYILDNKTDLTSEIVPVGTSKIITIYDQVVINPLGNEATYFSVFQNGTINIGNPLVQNNLNINSGIDFHFTQIIDTTITNYLLTINDYAVEIIADNINFITLPTAMGSAGRTYIISNGSNNINLVLQCQANEDIDTRPLLQLKRKHDHIKIQSNGIASWYVV